MPSDASYDKALLEGAPEVTPQQRQRFYDADLLYDDTNREGQRTGGDAAPLPTGAAPAAIRSDTDLEAGTVPRSKEYTALPPPGVHKTPWYKTRNGIIALVVLAIVVIGAVVGGAVGGTQANKSSKSDDNTTTQSQLPASISVSSSSSQVAGQGVGTVPVTSTPSTTQGAEQGTAAAPLASDSVTSTGETGQQRAGSAVAAAVNPVETGV